MEQYEAGDGQLCGRNTENEADAWKRHDTAGQRTIVNQFAEQGLIDEYQIMVDPVVIGDGTPIYKDIKHKLDLKLTATRTFKSGVVLRGA